jgi:hypothetical protein
MFWPFWVFYIENLEKGSIEQEPVLILLNTDHGSNMMDIKILAQFIYLIVDIERVYVANSH